MAVAPSLWRKWWNGFQTTPWATSAYTLNHIQTIKCDITLTIRPWFVCAGHGPGSLIKLAVTEQSGMGRHLCKCMDKQGSRRDSSQTFKTACTCSPNHRIPTVTQNPTCTTVRHFRRTLARCFFPAYTIQRSFVLSTRLLAWIAKNPNITLFAPLAPPAITHQPICRSIGALTVAYHLYSCSLGAGIVKINFNGGRRRRGMPTHRDRCQRHSALQVNHRKFHQNKSPKSSQQR